MLRRRNVPDAEKESNIQYDSLNDPIIEESKSIHSISSIYAIVFIICGVLLFDFIVIFDSILPTQLKITDEKHHPDQFIGERAQNHLKQLASIGPKITGSYENEVLAVDFLKREINFIIQASNRKQKIELDHQIVSGAYYLGFHPYGVVNNYENVQNIVVRIASQDNSSSSLLINCHFDSVPGSPGASDDGINCVTMLELIRVFSKESKRPKHNIIFLFNGAEENPLQAAHGFITKHKWAKECKAVINLEAAGLAEKEIVFQAGPGNNFLIKHYMDSVPRPRAQSWGEELFHLNYIPSDTDFRLFRDFGHIPGLDMAFAKNGYIYHTKYDDFDLIQPGAYQHIGDNLLALVRSLSGSDDLQKASLKSQEHSIYFDFLGLILFSYSETTAENMNLLICLWGIMTIFGSLMRIRQGSNFELGKEIILTGTIQLFGAGLSLLFGMLIARVLDNFNITMSWYTSPRIIFGLYFCPTLILLAWPVIELHQYQTRLENVNPSLKAQRNCHIIRMRVNFLLFVTTVIFKRTSYLFLVPALFATIAFTIILVFKLEYTRRLWIYIYGTMMIIPTIFYIYLYSLAMQLFIPITGRFGSDRNPEMYIGILSVLFCIIISDMFIALVPLLKKPFNVLIGLFMVFVITVLLIGFTRYGFPYANNKDLPTPQRYWTFHTARQFHNEKGDIIKKDSGYFLLNLDRNSPNILKDTVFEPRNTVPLEQDCANAIFCGLPIFSSRMIAIHKQSTWITAPPPIFHEPTSLHLVSKTKIKKDLHRFKFEAKGPDHFGIFISPKPNHTIVDWSFIDFIPPNPYIWNDRPTYFIMYGHGIQPEKPFTFWVDVKSPQDKNSTSFDIVLTGQYVHHEKSRTKDYKEFLSKFPSWTYPTAWLASYHSWVF